MNKNQILHEVSNAYSDIFDINKKIERVEKGSPLSQQDFIDIKAGLNSAMDSLAEVTKLMVIHEAKLNDIKNRLQLLKT